MSGAPSRLHEARGRPEPDERRALRLVVAALVIPLAAFAVQSLLWGTIGPFVWFLFYPAVFVSSWIGGLPGGLGATCVSTLLVWWAFIPPRYAFAKEELRYLLSAAVFVIMGVVFSTFHERLRKALGSARTANGRLQSANDEITALYERTKELDELKSRFFANVSHELRTPLALILGPTEQLLAAADTSDAVRRPLAVVARNARTLLRHVNDLLDASKLEAGGMKPEYADIDVARLLRLVASHFELLAQEKAVALRVEAPPELRAQVDAEKVRRVALNLLSNAFKFTPNGGRVRASLREGAPGRVVLEVSDSGPGIPADKREAVFERFRQLEGGATRRFGGTGLGLSIARDFVTLLGGTVRVTDAPEGGSLFVVELPRAAPEGASVRPAVDEGAVGAEEARQAVEELSARPRDEALPATCAAGKDALVLVVEDNPEMNRFICESLADRYRVASAFDGQDGLAKALALLPDVILSDVMMPLMSGDELLREVRARPELEATRVILLTAKADDELRVRLLREGAQDYVTKPFAVEELRARVANHVAQRRAEQRSRMLADRLESVARAMAAVSEAVGGLPKQSVSAVLKTITTQAQLLTGAEYAAIGLGTDRPRPLDPLGCAVPGSEHAAQLGRPMTSHLEVPIPFRGESPGKLYLANKRGAEEFDEEDRRLVEMLAARAGVAIETARLYQAEGLERAWLQTVIDQMPDGVLLMDAQGNVTTQSRSLQRLGLDVGALDPVVKPVALDLRFPSGAPVPREELPNVRALKHGEPTRAQEYVLRLRTGRLVPVEVTAAPVCDRGGEVIGATMIVRDVTPQKNLERLREEWTSVVAHDLRQPVAVIAASAQLLARARNASGTDATARSIERIGSAAQRLQRMIDDLLDASRIEARRLSVRRRAVDLAALVTEVVERLPKVARRCTLEFDEAAPRVVLADPDRIEQVLDNLLSNAAKYGTPGTPIAIRLASRGDEFEVTVSNEGPGIPPDELPRLFNRFARAKGAQADAVQGLGLGLYISRALIEAHGGRMWAESEPGHTTHFHFTLARAPTEWDRRSDDSGEPASPG